MPEISVAFPPQKVRTMVRDELRASFERTAQRGAMRLGIPREAVSAAMRQRTAAAVVAPPVDLTKAPRVATAAPTPSPPPQELTTSAPVATVAPAPTPAPSPIITRRVAALQLGALEASEMNPYFVDQPYTHQLGAALTIDPRVLRQHITAQKVATPLTTVSPRTGGTMPTSYETGWPVVQQQEEPDWTTYAMIGLAVVAVGGGVWYLKKKKKI